MNVELQAYTQPVVDGVTPEEFTAYVARIGKVKDNPEKLLRYLIKHAHWSPLEHTYVTFKIRTSRAVGRELLRHRSFTFQELSQRYEEVLSFEPVELRKQNEKNRQSSTKAFDPEIFPASGLNEAIMGSELVDAFLEHAQRVYQSLLKAGVARECARFVLPEATSTTLLMTGNIRSWIHFLAVRKHPDAQKEAQEIAEAIHDILMEQFPVIFKALDNE